MNKLFDIKPGHDFFYRQDSNGCTFDAMEIKHKECFIPNIIKYWDLHSLSPNMPGKQRNLSTFILNEGNKSLPALVMTLDLL